MIHLDGRTRRAFLKTSTGFIALPWLPSFVRSKALGRSTMTGPSHRSLAVFYLPNGVVTDGWYGEAARPTTSSLPSTLAALEPYRERLRVYRGLNLPAAEAGSDGAGDHARAGVSFLTCQRGRKYGGMFAGVSFDQALRSGGLGPWHSLSLGLEDTRGRFSCDGGYPCVYNMSLSWRSPETPVVPEVNPQLVFDAIFPSASAIAQKRERLAARRSILDATIRDAQSWRRHVAREDLEKVDSFLASVRSVEQSLSEGEAQIYRGDPFDLSPDASYEVRARSMVRLAALAISVDYAQAVNLMFGFEGSNQTYPFLGIDASHHYLSHHGNRPDYLQSLRQINRYHLSLFALFIEELEQLKCGERVVCLLGAGIRDGDLHDHEDLPVLIVSDGLGRSRSHLVETPSGTSLASLYLGLSKFLGRPLTRFADATDGLEITGHTT